MNNEENTENILKEEKKKRKKLMIIILILIILLLLCFSLYLLGYKIGKTGSVETTTTSLDPVLQVTQNNIDFGLIEDLDIFANKQYNNEKIIYPTAQGSYKFKIENVTGSNITYNILLSEENPLKFNLKYRLKMDNVYIIGNENTWVDINDFNIYDVVVTDKSENTYTIEWLWAEADNDTSIGETQNAKYKLKLNVAAKYYDEV